MKLGDFVTASNAGYWQLVDVKPKIVDFDYERDGVRFKKGEVIGKWVILKKAFTAKMKPRIEFAYEDSVWIRPVGDDIRQQINKYFADNPDFKEKFDNAKVKLPPMITNCWLSLPEEEENAFRETLLNLPSEFTEDEFWKVANRYKKYLTKPPAKYILNLLTYPWNMDNRATLIYYSWELNKE